MPFPGFTEQGRDISAVPASIIKGGVGRSLVSIVLERKQGAANSEDGFACGKKIRKMFHLRIGQFEVHGEDHHHVGRR